MLAMEGWGLFEVGFSRDVMSWRGLLLLLLDS